jgi:hypothetical protein
VDRPPKAPPIPIARPVQCCPLCAQTLSPGWLSRLASVPARWAVWMVYGGRGRTARLADMPVRGVHPADVERHLGTVPRALIERLRDLAQDLRDAGW